MLPSLLWNQLLSVFPFQALLLKIFKALRKRPFLRTVSADSLGEPGAQPMGASRLLEGPSLPMEGAGARTSHEQRMGRGG